MAKKKWPQLPKAFKRKWVAALRSGKYRQGNGYLKVKAQDENGKSVTEYCCLGVAGEIAGCKIPVKKELGMLVPGCGIKGLSKAPKVLIGEPNEDDGRQRLPGRLANMNDDGQSFKSIATWIDKHL